MKHIAFNADRNIVIGNQATLNAICDALDLNDQRVALRAVVESPLFCQIGTEEQQNNTRQLYHIVSAESAHAFKKSFDLLGDEWSDVSAEVQHYRLTGRNW